MQIRELRADEIEVRVAKVTEKGASLLLYKTARADMNVLDECVGAENWRKDYQEIKGNLYCTLYVKCADGWVGKQDCGIESRGDDGNEKKGEASDAFKRAGFCWGIGRELYTSPFIFVNLPTAKKDGRGYDLQGYPRLDVKEIEYKDGRISKIVITNNGRICYTFPANSVVYDDDVDQSAEAERIRKDILTLGGGDVPRIITFAEKLYPGIPYEDMTAAQLVGVKVALAKKLQVSA